MRAFQGFRGNQAKEGIIWQEQDSLFPFQCSQCNRAFERGGKRWLGSTMNGRIMSHHAVAVLCPDCKTGRDPLRGKVPKLAERRTEL